MNRTTGVGVATALLLLLAGCGGDDSQEAQDPGLCPAELVLDGVSYVQVDDSKPLAVGRALGDAQFTACGDRDLDAVRAWKLVGVAAGDAFAAEMGDSYMLYVVNFGKRCTIPYLRC